MKNQLVAIKLFYLAIIGLAVISCVPQSKMKYLQDKEGDTTHRSQFQNPKPDYKLKPGDYLHIRIMSLDEKSNQIFASVVATGGATGNTNTTDQELYLKSYMVNDSGYINFPLLGTVYANGQTIAEIEKTLTNSVSEIVQGASVVVKLVLYNITVLGEVKSPGKFTIYNNRVNVFEAFALAGDLTAFANRSKVQVIRSEGDKNNIIILDLINKDILSSPDYYLQPNDIVYIEPLKEKSFAFETFPYTLVYSTIGLVLVILTFFK
jgi:polysaccharide biosynthesis/export protein